MLPAVLLGGAAIGGLSSIINNLIKGSNERRAMRMQQRQMGSNAPMSGFNVKEGLSQLPRFNQQQSDALSQLLQQGLQGWQQNQPNFAPIKQQAITDFETRDIPMLAERFASSGAKASGPMQGAILGAQGRFKQGLAGLEQGFAQQNRNQLLQLLGLTTQSPYEYLYKERQPGFAESATVASLPGLIQALPGLIQLYQQSGAQ